MGSKGPHDVASKGSRSPSVSYELQPSIAWGANVSAHSADGPETPDVELGASTGASPERLLKKVSSGADMGGVSTPVWHLTDAADLLRNGHGGAYEHAIISKAVLRSPSSLSTYSFAHRHRNLAFWTRVALVLLLAFSVMGTALFVLRLYNATMYQEAVELGLGMLYQMATVAHMQMADFVNEMVTGTLVLSANLHGQGLAPLIQENVYHPLARSLLWEMFKSVPFAEYAAYGTDRGAVTYLRREGDPTAYLILGHPVNASQSLGAWVGAIAPADPELGTWTVPEANVPFVPISSVTQLPYFRDGLTQPRGVVGWWTGLLPTGSAANAMVYAAMTSLTVVNEGANQTGDAASANGTSTLPSPALANGTSGARNSTVIGVVGMTKSTNSLHSFLSRMDATLHGGRLFFSLVKDGMLVIANEGQLSREVPGSASNDGKPLRAAITADLSDDPVIAAAGKHLRAAFSVAGPVIGKRNSLQGIAGNGSEDTELALAAAQAGLCWYDYDTVITVGGKRWYLHCHGSVYGGSRGRLPMVGVMLLPRKIIMGAVDHTKHRLLVIVLAVTLSIAVLGVLGVYISTLKIKQMAKEAKALENEVEKQEGEMEKMAKELDHMRALLPSGTSGRVSMDMRTPMETINDLLSELSAQNKVPTSETLNVIQSLLKMPELHMPVVLQDALANHSGGSSSGPNPVVKAMGGVPPQMLDDDLSAWLRSTVMRLPRTSSLASNRADIGIGALSFYRRSEPDELTLVGGSPLMRTMSGPNANDDGTLDTVVEIMRQVIQQGQPEEEMSLKDYGTYAMGRSSTDFGTYARMRISASSHLPTLPDDDVTAAPPGTLHVISSPEMVYPRPHPTVIHAALAGAGAAGGGVGGGGRGGGGHQQHPAMQAIRASLEGIGRWNYDTMELALASSGQPILWMGLELYRRAGVLKVFKLPLDKLTRFLLLLDDGMPANKYHNSTHIADVANSLYHLIRHSGVGSYLTRLDVLAAITAALVHDFRHPGLNNDFVVRSSDALALRYNDRTVLENFHVAEAFILLAMEELNFLDVLDKEDFKYVRNAVIELVLGSDLKRHFELVELFKKRIKDKENPISRESETDRLLLMQIALKVADIGHSAKKLAIHKKWTDAITEEFYLQGDKEKAQGFKVSPFMDRENNDLPKSQVWLGMERAIVVSCFTSEM
eukprot:jgi/Mesvir1/9423/Mv01523-RA.2